MHHRPPVAPALLHTLLYRDCPPPGVQTGFVLPVTRKHSARLSVSSRVVSTQRPTKDHRRTNRTRGLTLRKQRRPTAVLRKARYKSLNKFLSAVTQELVLNHETVPEACDIHFRRVKRAAARVRGQPEQASALPFLRFNRAQRLGGSTGPDLAASPTAVTHSFLLVDARRGLWRPTLHCGVSPSQVPRHTWCCPQTKLTVLATAQGPWSAHVPVRLRDSAFFTCSNKCATELDRTNGKSLSSAPLFLASSGNVATKVQVSSALRQAASLIGMAPIHPKTLK